MKPTPKIISHRGFSSEFPENTLVAFLKAIEIGADFIELDVHKTKDHKIVVIHDDSVDRTSCNDKKGAISEMNLKDLEEVTVGYSAKFGAKFKNEKIPTLKEVLELAKGKIKVCIEVKVENAEQEILEIIRKTEMENEVILFSFFPSVLQNFKNLNQKIPTLFLVEEFSNEALSNAKEMDCFAIGVGNETLIDENLIHKLHSQNIEIWQWTIDDEEEMQRLMELKVDGLITNKPDKAKFIKQNFLN